jgi:hypothetical protein
MGACALLPVIVIVLTVKISYKYIRGLEDFDYLPAILRGQ